jgi:hypothetical protein
MAIFDITPAGALVNAIEVAAKRDKCEAARCTTTAPKSPRSGWLAFAMAQLRSTFTREFKTAEDADLTTEARSRPA